MMLVIYLVFFILYYRYVTVPYRGSFFFFFNDTATTEIYTLSLHDALPIPPVAYRPSLIVDVNPARATIPPASSRSNARSEEHTSELQSHLNLVCRLLLEKTNNYRLLHETLESKQDY